mgnify:CR=1 FL=1
MVDKIDDGVGTGEGVFCLRIDAAGKCVRSFGKNTRSINKHNLPAMILIDRLQVKPRGLRFGRGDRYLVTQDMVKKR